MDAAERLLDPDRPPPSFGHVLAALGLVVLPLLLGPVLSVVAIWLLLRWLLG